MPSTLRNVIEEAWLRGISVSGDFARKHAATVAMAASLNLITTRYADNNYGYRWQVTTKGLRWLNEQD